MDKTKYTINDLPRYSSWPTRLLGLETWEQRSKTPETIHREYENEKWSSLLKKVENSKREIVVEEVDEWVFKDSEPSLCSINDKLNLLSRSKVHQQFVNLVARTLQTYLPASALVELGAGYGSVILALAKKNPFRKLNLIAGEYTSSGVKLIEKLAESQNLKIQTGHCDFGSPGVTNLSIPPDAIIFTSFATPCVPNLPASFVHALHGFHPRAVIHFEPCYEHCNGSTLIGLMRRRYIEVNDYNKNLVTLLHEKQMEGSITIAEERPAVIGPNPLLSASILTWQPR